MNSTLRNPVWSTDDNLRDPSIFRNAGGYHIFYSRYTRQNPQLSESWSVAQAFTRDFMTFVLDRDISPHGHASPGDVIHWHGRYILPYQTYPAAPTELVFSESFDLEQWSSPKPFLAEVRLLPWNELQRAIDPAFVIEGDRLHCFFVGSAMVSTPTGETARANLLGQAVTQDPALQEWEILTRSKPLIGVSERAPDGVENISVFRTDHDWTMIYSEGLNNQHLALATSYDLIHWEYREEIKLPRQKWMARKYGAPFVWREQNEWIMMLMGEDSEARTTFGILSSGDGLNWTLLPERETA